MADQTWQRAPVTGASSGIGVRFAEQLAEGGTDLVLVARSRDRLEDLAERLVADHGVTAEVLVADLGDSTERAAVEDRLSTLEDPVDLLVNNAGFGFNGVFGEIDVEAESEEITVNITALLRLAHASANTLRVLGHGGILNVASVAAFQPGPGSANYSATKAYVLSFSQALHEELKGANVHVTALCPGLTRTEFQERAPAEQRATVLATYSLGMMGAGALIGAPLSGVLIENIGLRPSLIANAAAMLTVVAWSALSARRRPSAA